mmetsp:Transcript_5371/g.7878  ORF Transcript_5371/g.7878 Transcript_5371/m.7878 type:complete len:81 (+) Transcript_5371:604-846(+)
MKLRVIKLETKHFSLSAITNAPLYRRCLFRKRARKRKSHEYKKEAGHIISHPSINGKRRRNRALDVHQSPTRVDKQEGQY